MYVHKKQQKGSVSAIARKAGLLIFTLLIAWNVKADSGWELKKDKDGIKIYTRSNTASAVKALKAEFEAKGTVVQMARLLTDVSRQKDWVYSTKSATLVRRINNNEFIYYSEKKLPWPLVNRDVVMHMKVVLDSAAGTLNVTGRSVEQVIPVHKDLVRVTFSEVSWQVHTLNATTIRIEYQAQADPAGDVPAWVSNMFLIKGPFETFSALRKLLSQ